MTCSIPGYIQDLNLPEEETLNLFEIDHRIRQRLSQSKLFERRDNKLIMPKNNYGKALSFIGQINVENGTQVVFLGKREIGEVLKVNVSNLLTNEFNTKLFESGSSLDEVENEISVSANNLDTNFFSINEEDGRQIWKNSKLPLSERRESFISSFEARVSNLESFNGRLFDKLSKDPKMGFLGLSLTSDKNHTLFATKTNVNYNPDLLLEYLDKLPLEVNKDEFLEVAISEELIHVLTLNLINKEQTLEFLKSTPTQWFRDIQKIYRSLKTGDFGTAFLEGVRMKVQKELLGKTTEEVRDGNYFKKVLKEILDYILSLFNSEVGNHIYQLHKDYINSNSEDIKTKLTDLLKKINPAFKIEILDNLIQTKGANALIDFKNFVIQLQEGKEDKLTEEVAHLFIELLPADSPVLKGLLSEVVRTKLWKQIVSNPKYQEAYEGDLKSLKKEAAGQLVSLYLTNKKEFNRLGSADLLTNIITWIKELFGWIKKEKRLADFILVANSMMKADTSLLDTQKEIEIDLMYSFASAEELKNFYQEEFAKSIPLFQSLRNRNLNKYEKVYINLNDTVFDTKDYLKRNKKKARKVFFGGKREREKYLKEVKLTALGRELRDKKQFLKNKFIIYTSMELTDKLKSRLMVDLGLTREEVESILIRSVEEKIIEDDKGKLISSEIGPSSMFEEIKRSPRNILVVDNEYSIKNPFVGTAVQVIPFNASNSFYENFLERRDRALQNFERENRDLIMSQQFSQLDSELVTEINRFIQLLNNDAKVFEEIERLIEKIDNNTLKEVLKDKFEQITIPVEASKKLKALATKNGIEDLLQASKNFLSLIDFTQKFYQFEFEDLKDSEGRISTMLNDPESVHIAVYELNKIIQSINKWKEYINGVKTKLEGREGTKEVEKIFDIFLGDISNLEREAVKKASEAVSKRLLPFFEGYNANKKVRIAEIKKSLETGKKTVLKLFGGTKEVSLNSDELEVLRKELQILEKVSQIDSEVLTQMLFGFNANGEWVDDLNAATVYIKTLINSSDPLVYGVDALIQRALFQSSNRTLREIQEQMTPIVEKIKNYGLAEKVDKLIYTDYDLVWDESLEKSVPKERLSLLNPYKNLYRYKEEKFKVEQLRKKYQNTNSDSDKEAWEEAQKGFKEFESTYFYREFSADFYKRFDSLKEEYSDIWEEVTQEYNSYFSSLQLLEDRLMFASEEETVELQKQISIEKANQRKLRSLFYSSGQPKEGRDLRAAQLLLAKTEIDSEYFENEINHKIFRKDLLSRTGNNPQVVLLLNNKDYKGVRKILEQGNRDLLNWFDINTRSYYTQEFYEQRKLLFDQIQELQLQLNPDADNSFFKELWEKIISVSSPYRDKNGVIYASAMTLEEQKVVQEIQQTIEDEKLRINKLEEEEKDKSRKAILKEISKLFNELKEIQEKNLQPTYELEFMDKVFEIDGNKSFAQKYEEATGVSISFLSSSTSLRQDAEFQKLLQEDSSFGRWYKSNHIVKTKDIFAVNEYGGYDKVGEKEEEVPTYIWTVITPTDNNQVQIEPIGKYSSRTVKPEHRTSRDFYSEELRMWLPLPKRGTGPNDFWNEEWHRLNSSGNPEDIKLAEVLRDFSKFHLASQKDIPSSGKIGWFLPSVQKSQVEGVSVTNTWKDILDKANKFEEGEANNPNLPKQKKGLLEKAKILFNEGVMEPFEEMFDLSSRSSQDKIPVAYSYWSESKNISTDLPIIFSMFRGSTNAANALFHSLPTVNLSINSMEANSQRFLGKKANNKENRIEAIKFIRGQRIYGINKQYELGEGLDNVSVMVRKINSFGSLSDLTGFLANVKNNIAGNIQNLIQGEMLNWTNASSLSKAIGFHRNNLIWFLNESEKKVKSKDWYIQTFFNPSNDSLINIFALEGSKKRFAKTKLFQYQSTIMEYGVSGNILYAHLFHKKVKKGNQVKSLYDILKAENGILSAEEGWVDSYSGRAIDENYLLDKKKTFMSLLENINGKVSQKTYLATTTIGQSLLYFKNWLIPMVRRRFDSKRENYALEEDVEGYWRTFFRLLKSIFIEKKNSYNSMSLEEQRNVVAALKEIAAIIAMSLIISLVFGFDYDDKDKMKKLKERSYLFNVALLTVLQAQAETESLSPFMWGNVGNKGSGVGMPPILMEGWKVVEKPFIGFQPLTNAFKAAEGWLTLEQYERDMPNFNIVEDEYKGWHYTQKMLQIDDLRYSVENPTGKINNFLNALKR